MVGSLAVVQLHTHVGVPGASPVCHVTELALRVTSHLSEKMFILMMRQQLTDTAAGSLL